MKRYRPILKGNVEKLLKAPSEAAANIREQFVQKHPKMKEWFQLGHTKVFLKEKARSAVDKLLEEARYEQTIKI